MSRPRERRISTSRTVPVARDEAGYQVDKADAPAVDIQQAGSAFQRLTFSVVVFLGALGAVALLGTLSLAVILAQVVALVLLGFAPVALVIGFFPGAGHDLFRGWLAKLATAIFIKALYSLVIALVVAVSAALTAATSSLGFLFAFGLQTLFFWALFVYRKQITARLVAATTGAAHHDGLPRTSVVKRGAAAASAPVTALVGVSRRDARSHGAQQESALSGSEDARSRAGENTHSSPQRPAPCCRAHNRTARRTRPVRQATASRPPELAARSRPASRRASRTEIRCTPADRTVSSRRPRARRRPTRELQRIDARSRLRRHRGPPMRT